MVEMFSSAELNIETMKFIGFLQIIFSDVHIGYSRQGLSSLLESILI